MNNKYHPVYYRNTKERQLKECGREQWRDIQDTARWCPCCKRRYHMFLHLIPRSLKCNAFIVPLTLSLRVGNTSSLNAKKVKTWKSFCLSCLQAASQIQDQI